MSILPPPADADQSRLIDSAKVVGGLYPNIQFFSGPTFEYYRISNAQPGQWSGWTFGNILPPQPEPYRIYMATQTDLTMDVALDKDRYVVGEPVYIQVLLYNGGERQSDLHLFGGEPITDAIVEVEVTDPPGIVNPPISLAHAGEGLYTYTFAATTNPGSYKLTVKALRIADPVNNILDFYRQSEHSAFISSTEYILPTARSKILEAREILLNYTNAPQKDIKKSMHKALEHIDKSLSSNSWEDDNHLTEEGDRVFKELREAINKLMKLLDENAAANDALTAINHLLTATNILASLEIDAVACNGNYKCEKELEKANKEMEKAALQYEKHNFDTASEHHQVAWSHALNARKKKSHESDEDEIEAFQTPTEYQIYQNYPNPFNPWTDLRYELPRDSRVTLKIYNILGQTVRTLVDNHQSAGTYIVRWDGKNDNGDILPSGIYIYRFQADKFVAIRKMLFTK